MLKRKFSVFLIILLSVALILPAFIASVSSSSGAIYINSKTASTPGQQIQAGGSVNLYLGSVTWTGEQTFFMLTPDNSLADTTGYIYTPGMSVYHIADTTQTHTYTFASGGYYSWVVGDYWVNGTIPQSIVPGNYYIKAIDDVSSQTAITDTCITVTALSYVASLNISPSAGPGGVPITFTGSGYPAGDKISIQYYDPVFNQWRLMTETTVDAKGQISVNSTAPDLKKSVGSYDSEETYTEIQYRTQGVGVPGGAYSSANYAQYARGLKTVGDQTAYGLFGNGTNLQSVQAIVGETLAISGKWFHSNDQIYIRWGSDDILGTITSDQWANAKIIGSTIASKNGSFSTTLTIPETAYAGEHYIAIEDSEARVAIKIYVSKAYLEITPSSGPGGANVQFTGSLYPPNTNINICYLDPDLNTWNYWTNTLSDSTGKISFSTKIPDLNKAGYGGESIGSTTISFRTEINQIPYAYAAYTQYWRGLSQVGNAIAYYGVFGDGTNLAQRINVEPGDKLYVSGRWFHSNDAIYVRFDDNQIIGSSYNSPTLTSDDWLKAEIIGKTTANAAGSFETTITIPETLEGAHYIAFEDSERRVSIIISVTVPNNSTPTPTPPPTPAPTPPTPTTNPTKPPPPTPTHTPP
ncbi:MAG: hypothetical protein LBH79_08495, partial [Nitrososphaerota archaeon]|nr:hypothetical protein [Nitrososphaerota archaeon]